MRTSMGRLGVSCVIAIALGHAGVAPGATVFEGTASATFGTPTPSSGVFYTGVGTNVFSTGAPLPGAQNNLYTILANSFSTGDAEPFAVAELVYRNGQTFTGTDVSSVPVAFGMAFSNPAGIGTQSFSFTFQFTFTENDPDLPLSDPVNDDLLTVRNVQAETTFFYLGNPYTLRLLGFGPDADHLASRFRLPENQITSSLLWAEIAAPIIVEPPTNPVPLPAGVWVGLGVVGAWALRKTLNKKEDPGF